MCYRLVYWTTYLQALYWPEGQTAEQNGMRYLLHKPTRILQSGVSKRATVASMLIRQVGPRVVRTHGAVIGRVSQRATVGGRSRSEGPVVLRGPDGVQTVDRVMAVRQAGGGLLVSGVTVAAKFQECRFGRIGWDQSVRYRAHSHHWGVVVGNKNSQL